MTEENKNPLQDFDVEKLIPVIVESPYAAADNAGVEKNIAYARQCLLDSFSRGEAPFASHLLYTQEGVLDDRIPEQRVLGIAAGLFWGRFAKKSVVYMDLGMSSGMEEGIRDAEKWSRPIEYRRILNTADSSQTTE